VVLYGGITISRWQTAAILKIVIPPYLSGKSSDFDEILYTAADFELDERHVIKTEKVALDRLRDRQNVFLVWNNVTSGAGARQTRHAPLTSSCQSNIPIQYSFYLQMAKRTFIHRGVALGVDFPREGCLSIKPIKQTLPLSDPFLFFPSVSLLTLPLSCPTRWSSKTSGNEAETWPTTILNDWKRCTMSIPIKRLTKPFILHRFWRH